MTSLAGCGGESPPSPSPAAAPPAAAAPEGAPPAKEVPNNGASSPEEVVARLAEAVEQKDWVLYHRQTPPDDLLHGAALKLSSAGMMGMLPEGLPVPEPMKKVVALQKEHAKVRQAFLERYGVSADDPAIDGRYRKSDPKKLAKLFEGIDLPRFVGELTEMTWAQMIKESEAMPGPHPKDWPRPAPMWPVMAVYQRQLTDLRVEGDKATGMLGDFKVRFVKVDGRWYHSDRRD
jgi:hypothetical protein